MPVGVAPSRPGILQSSPRAPALGRQVSTGCSFGFIQLKANSIKPRSSRRVGFG